VLKRLLIVVLSLISLNAAAQSDRGLAKAIAEDLNMEQEEVFQVIKAFKKEVIVALRDDDVVRLQGLGQFYVEHLPARPGNSRTGEMKETPAKDYLRFKASTVGNQSLNAPE